MRLSSSSIENVNEFNLSDDSFCKGPLRTCCTEIGEIIRNGRLPDRTANRDDQRLIFQSGLIVLGDTVLSNWKAFAYRHCCLSF